MYAVLSAAGASEKLVASGSHPLDFYDRSDEIYDLVFMRLELEREFRQGIFVARNAYSGETKAILSHRFQLLHMIGVDSNFTFYYPRNELQIVNIENSLVHHFLDMSHWTVSGQKQKSHKSNQTRGDYFLICEYILLL